MVLFMMGCILAIGYFIFKLIRVNDVTQNVKYQYTGQYLTFFGMSDGGGDGVGWDREWERTHSPTYSPVP